ncbi:ABC transporter permease [Puia dinghuensis]|uniref:ABC transporter permease n=1 Tax=Puia dinghuensis TaxID=1792502 RepID=A0A8J2XTN8_9BACT|nr:ABC transporter permease [Puia dinghuensis]GGB18928.1 ABC transporter permease [Puia dinghuensis]
MRYIDTISLAYRNLRGNRLRTGITVSIIAFGIMALVGINTAIDAMKQKFTESFSAMGANGFTIHNKKWFNFHDGPQRERKGLREKKSNSNVSITKYQAETFQARFQYPATVSLNINGSQDAVVSMGDVKTNPNVRILGGDENYIDLNGFSLAAGRNLNTLDVRTGRNVAIIGSTIAQRFFGKNPEAPLEKIINVNNLPFRVVGVLETKGSTLGMNQDNVIITSYNNVRRFFNVGGSSPFGGGGATSFNIQVKVADVKLIDGAIDQAEGVFRPIRRLEVTEGDNFNIDKSDTFVNLLLKNLAFITGAAVIIGLITLVGAAVALMNIMLVAVTERTKEIGLVKAIGGRQRNVRQQFLFESVLISLIGAGFGVVLGVLVGNVFSLVLSTGFVMPWAWMLGGIFICSLVGLAAGLYPSLKAARLNPIEALRYE